MYRKKPEKSLKSLKLLEFAIIFFLYNYHHLFYCTLEHQFLTLTAVPLLILHLSDALPPSHLLLPDPPTAFS